MVREAATIIRNIQPPYHTNFLDTVFSELINSAVGSNAEKEKRLALEQLHSVLSVKRKGIWTKVYESLMKRHLELCVDLKDHLTAKDGLHQYRNLCQTVSFMCMRCKYLAVLFVTYTLHVHAHVF